MKNKVILGLWVLMLALVVGSELGVAGNGRDSARILEDYNRDNRITHNGITDEIIYTNSGSGLALARRRNGVRYTLNAKSGGTGGTYTNLVGEI